MKINLVKYILLFSILLILMGCTTGQNKNNKRENKRPNILFIMSDDHTSQAWGIYGGILKDHVKNINIKRLADEGMVLNNVYCTNSICVPSRAAILTGKYSHKNGVYTLDDPFPKDSLNIAKLLRENGYQTAIIGKWHLKTEPQGFDYYNILFDQGRYWDPILRTADNFHKKPEEWDVHKGFSTDIITDLSIEWLEQRDSDKPFLLMTHFKATHEPFDFPERFNDLYEGVVFPEPESLLDFSPTTTGRSFEGLKLESMGENWVRSTADPDSWWCKYPELPFSLEGMDSIAARKKIYQKLVKDFLRSGAAIDDNIGKLLDYLEDSDLAENTVVIYTADQGYFLGEHGFYDKRIIYEESLRMPFVIRYPKEISAANRIDDIILNIDFASLIADYAEVPMPDSFQGKSFRDNLKGETPEDWRKSAYYRYWQHMDFWPGHFGIINKNYKLVFFYGQPLGMTRTSKNATEPAWEFFDLKKDPYETKNEYNNSDYNEIISKMKIDLQNQRELVGERDINYPEMTEIFNNYWNK